MRRSGPKTHPHKSDRTSKVNRYFNPLDDDFLNGILFFALIALLVMGLLFAAHLENQDVVVGAI